MFFARKFSTKKTPELLDMIDNYMLFNQSSEAGLYWPGFFEVDTTTPGKQWVQAHNKRKRDEMIIKKKNRNIKINGNVFSSSSLNNSLISSITSGNTVSIGTFSVKDTDVTNIQNSGRKSKKIQKKIFFKDKNTNNEIAVESDPSSNITLPDSIGIEIENMDKKKKGMKKRKHFFSSFQ